MSRKISHLDINEILNRIGMIVDSGKRCDIAAALGRAPSTLTNWTTAKRGTIPFYEMVDFAMNRGILLSWLLEGKGPMYENDIPGRPLPRIDPSQAQDFFIVMTKLYDLIYHVSPEKREKNLGSIRQLIENMWDTAFGKEIASPERDKKGKSQGRQKNDRPGDKPRS